MPVTYDSPDAKVLEAEAAFFEADATLQAIFGTTADTAATRARIYEVDAGGTAELPYLLLSRPLIDRSTPGGSYVPLVGENRAQLRYTSTAAQTPAEDFREALNIQGAIAGAMANASYLASFLPNLTIRTGSDSPVREDRRGAHRGTMLIVWRLSWFSPRIV